MSSDVAAPSGRVLVTGGTGFIGSSLAVRLGRAVTALLVLLLSFLVGRAIVLSPRAHFGAWLVNLAPVGVVATSLVLMLVASRRNVDAYLVNSAPVSRRQLVVVTTLIAAVGIGVTALLALVGGVTYWVLGTVALGMFVVAVVLALTGNLFQALSLFLLSLPLVHFFEYEFRDVVSILTPTAVLLWLFGTAVAMRLSVEGRAWARTTFDKYVLILLASLVWAAALSADSWTSFQTVFYVLSFAVLFPIVVQCVRTREDAVQLLVVVAAVGLIRITGLVYFSYFKPGSSIFDPLSYFGQTRWQPTWMIGSWCILVVPLCFAGTMAYRQVRRRVAFGVAMVWGLVASVPLLGRSIVAAVVLGLAPFVFQRKSRVPSIAVLAGGVALSAAAWPTLGRTMLGRFREFRSWGSVVANERMRLDAWRSAIEMMRDHPVSGIGPGRWPEVVPSYATVFYETDGGYRQYVPSAHSIFLHEGAVAGVAGFLATLAVALVMVRRAIALARRERDWRHRQFTLGLLGLVIAFWFSAAVAGYALEVTSFSDSAYLFWLVLGLVATSDRITGLPQGGLPQRSLQGTEAPAEKRMPGRRSHVREDSE